MWNLSPFREVNLVHRKMLTVPALWNIMKFQHFFKVHQISSNLQNLLESSSETCMWNLSPFREVSTFFKVQTCRKMLTVPRPFEISWNFNIFSKFTKFHQTCRIYWNHHQKHACEIWAHSEKLTYFIEKCCTLVKFQHFFKVHQISSNLQNLLESSSETCMWNLSPFREVITVQALEISWNFNIFSKFTKFHQTCRTYLNHHQKHACEIWAHSEKLT